MSDSLLYIFDKYTQSNSKCVASLEDKGEMVLNCRKRKEGMNLFEAFKLTFFLL